MLFVEIFVFVVVKVNVTDRDQYIVHLVWSVVRCVYSIIHCVDCSINCIVFCVVLHRIFVLRSNLAAAADVYMSLPTIAGGGILFAGRPSVRPFTPISRNTKSLYFRK